jgi:hypothetical protein
MAVGGAMPKSDGKDYPGNMTVFVFLACLVASSGGLIFGYDIGISGEFTGRSVVFHETASETN